MTVRQLADLEIYGRAMWDDSIKLERMLLSKAHGMIRDRTYCIRLYDSKDLSAMVALAGFGSIQVFSDASALNLEVDVGCMNRLLVVSARKP